MIVLNVSSFLVWDLLVNISLYYVKYSVKYVLISMFICFHFKLLFIKKILKLFHLLCFNWH